MADFSGAPVDGDLAVRWIHGTRTKGDASGPPIQVHRYDEHTFILRQSMSVSHEAPFLYLLLGNDRALLLDTGATADPAAFPLRETIDELVTSWLDRHPRSDYELVVAHTHSHGDHIAGDAQFAGRPRTTVVGTDLEAVRSFFGLPDRPDGVARLDLGGRVLDVIAAPGHHPTALAFFDPWTGFLLTGDTVYPGRIYGFDMPQLVATMDRLVDFADSRPVTHVMGCHIEMSRRPGRDYPVGARYQPDEPPLQMTTAQLRAVRDAVHAAAAKPGVYVHDDFVVVSGMGKRTVLRLLLRSLGQRISSRVP